MDKKGTKKTYIAETVSILEKRIGMENGKGMSQYEVTQYYKSVFEKSDCKMTRDDYRWVFLWEPICDYLEKKCLSPNDIRILDVACGDGRYTRELYNRGFRQVYAIDLFDSIEHDIGGVYIKSSMDALPFAAEEFDVIFCFSAIYHLKDVDNGLREFSRCLKPGGYLILTAHTKYSMFTVKNKIGLWIGNPEHDNLKGVKFDRDVSEYIKLLRNNGFDIVKQDGVYISLFYVFIYLRLVKAIERRKQFLLPIIKPRYTNRIWGRIKSHIAYHAVVFAVKK